MGLVRDICYMTSSVVTGVAATCMSVYLIFFVMNIHLSFLLLPTIDGSPYYSSPGYLIASPLLNNMAILTVFITQHSFVFRGPIRKVMDLFLTEEAIRLAYVQASSVLMACVFLFWAPMTYTLWDIQREQLRMAVYVVSGLCWTGLYVSMITLDPVCLFGVQPIIDWFKNNEKKEEHFVTSGVYGLMRHPICTFSFISLWITPTMVHTIGHVLFSIVFTAYVMLAVVYFEEPDLITKIGPQYIEYMKTTPRFLPRLLNCHVSRIDKKQ